MPRLARTVAVGCAHHITQRGNNRQDVFFVDDDRRVYLELLAEQAERYGLEILGYCLMSNHVHLRIEGLRYIFWGSEMRSRTWTRASRLWMVIDFTAAPQF
jgi:REP element-mobilizing transposase RayT